MRVDADMGNFAEAASACELASPAPFMATLSCACWRCCHALGKLRESDVQSCKLSYPRRIIYKIYTTTKKKNKYTWTDALFDYIHIYIYKYKYKCLYICVYIYGTALPAPPPPPPPMVMGQASTPPPPLWLWSCGWVVVVYGWFRIGLGYIEGVFRVSLGLVQG